MKTKRLAALSTALALTLSAISASALYTEGDTANDGYSLGYYEEEVDSSARLETEALYAARPKTERQYDNLSRGLVAVKDDSGVLISWRYLGTDAANLCYNLYKGDTRLNASPIQGTNFYDSTGVGGETYTLREVVSGVENGTETTVTAWDNNYISIPVEDYGDSYIIDDGAVGDLDGDGEYEIVVRRTPTNMDPATRTVYPLLEAYDTDGTHMWTINVGPNEINEVDINFVLYDFDGDGKSEMIMRSFEGTTDGTGNTLGDLNGDGITDYSTNTANLAIFTDRQYIISTPEYLSMYDGETGAELTRTDLLPSKEPLSEWSYRYTDTGRLTKRASHFLFGVAYLDGVTPSIVMVRGAWDNVRAAAWHISDGAFAVDWVHDTENTDDVNSIWGACNHNLITADVDFDGCDEILSGPMAIDHDGSEMYATQVTDNDGNVSKLLHGDAFDVAKMDPDFNGYLSWACHENSPLLANIELHDARTGQVLWGYGKNKDTGRSRAADIDPNYRGYEVWGSTGTIPMNISGEKLADSWNEFKYRLPDGSFEKAEDGTDAVGSLPMNFMVYWDGDLLGEFLDGTRISKWNYDEKLVDVIYDATECASNGGTKAVPVMCADILGDWREEVIWKTSDEKSLRIYSTTYTTDYKITTLMQDPYYRASVAIQNNHYNQPANVSFYLGAETETAPLFEGYVMIDGVRVTNPDLGGNNHREYTVNVGAPTAVAQSLKLLINSPYALIDGAITDIDTDSSIVPAIVDDRTLVPVRFIAESFGMDVSFDDATRVITITGNGYEIIMTLDSQTYTVNGTELTLDVPAQSYNGRTMIPLRAMAESIGKSVYWDPRGYIEIANTEVTDTASVDTDIDTLTSGVAPTPAPTPTPVPATPTPLPTAEPDPLADITPTEYEADGETWNLYFDEDFSSYSVGDSGGWAGTKPAPLSEISVTNSDMGRCVRISGSDKGNRNAIWHTGAAVGGTARIELDWKNGECTGGSSYGELRFADSAGNVFLGFKTVPGEEIQYSYGGKISNGGLETAAWTNCGSGFKANTVYHITIVADFDAKTATFTLANGTKTTSGTVEIPTATNFEAIEVLAVRLEKNFDWTTEVGNIKVAQRIE